MQTVKGFPLVDTISTGAVVGLMRSLLEGPSPQKKGPLACERHSDPYGLPIGDHPLGDFRPPAIQQLLVKRAFAVQLITGFGEKRLFVMPNTG